ncbi:type II TA system antitoxin MqsA family protein [Methylomonas sp. UP202]|uniref:type II TA system antitoxin MqsA family protein n=1 Tax=Methylomonas sp. UP202 TaxID=3040943 RepID=UPI00247A0B6F|nr:type II TA system antitoxin MqsA family protein [Methylomonas sp. UP202]WGS85826.1 type II toxin-antitoxin system MqsA family antitoxin [Methylomonas sp. UP202]
MKCPSCGAAELMKDTRDLEYTYKGESTVIPDVTGKFCPACDEVITDAEESRRTMALMMEFNKQVNASIVEPSFIASVPKS